MRTVALAIVLIVVSLASCAVLADTEARNGADWVRLTAREHVQQLHAKVVEVFA